MALSALAGYGQARSADAVDEAWRAWGENKQAEVEAKFTAALKQDPANRRAALGLFLLYRMQANHAKAWQSLKPVLLARQDAYPYLFAEWTSSALTQRLYGDNPEVLALYQKWATGADEQGVLKAMANQVLGEYYRARGNLLKSDEHFKALNIVRQWLVLGPFENVSASGFEKVFPPEKEFAPQQTYEAKHGIPAKWFAPAELRADQWFDFRRYFTQEQAVYYANTFVFSPKKQMAQLRVGTSGAVKVFLNDEQVFSYFEETDNDLDTFLIETELQEGWNRVLIKTASSEIENCNFMLRLTDRAGEALAGLQIASEAKEYKTRPGAPVKLVDNFAEAYFRARIKEQPEQLENYALLADAYLRNDKATEGELALKDALKRLPNCALFHTRLLDAYSRGDKNDEYHSTHALLYTLDKNIPQVLEYRLDEHFERGEFDKAEEVLKEYERLLPGSESLYELRLSLHNKKDETDKANALVQTAVKLFPSNWTFVSAQAEQSVTSTKRYTRAIALLEQYLLKNYEYEALTTLAGYYLEIPNLRKWAELYNKALELSPASAGIHSYLAGQYLEMKDYVNAEKQVRKALALCPSGSSYWATLGEIQRIRKQTPLALQSYREALRFDPFDYESRRILRELEGKPLIWSLFENNDVKQLIAKAPDAKAYPESGAVILLEDTKRAVYPEGASEMAGELLIKIFNKQGIDAFKEQYLPYNAYTQALTVEQAVSIKPNGTEIKADTQGGQIVFKSLEENDVIHLKWNLKNYNSGKLFKDFWDTKYFSRVYPYKQMRYSLLVPQDYQFAVSTHNMPNQPVKKETEAGVIHQWAAQDEPAIVPEVNMPGLDEVGKVLYVSSITSWETLVAWYTDLASAKTRSTFEIKEQVAKLVADKSSLTDEEKIERVYNFITENIRYSSVSFRQSALTPQKARDVLVNKIGDCKDVSTLGIAMLNELGVKSYYTLVNTRDAGQNRNALPGILFNHCIIAVETSQGLRYLDLTAHNYPVNELPILDKEAFSLLIKPGVKQSALLPQKQTEPSTIKHATTINVIADLSLQVQQQTEWLGEAAAYPRMAYRYKGPAELDKMLTETYSTIFPGMKLVKQEIKGIDAPVPAASGAYQFDVPSFLSEAGQFKLLKLPWLDRFSIFPAPSLEKRKYPYLYLHYAGRLEHRIEIKLPAGYEPLDLGKDVAITSPVADYKLSFSYANGVVTARKEIVNKKQIVTPEEYDEFKQFYTRVVKEEDRAILLKTSN